MSSCCGGAHGPNAPKFSLDSREKASGRGDGDEAHSFDWEDRDEKTPFWHHAAAGSCAGITEHVAMYPLDTVKTRLQTSSGSVGVRETVQAVLREQRGAMGLWRGASIIGIGCIPAHVSLFSTYEYCKLLLMDGSSGSQPTRAALCGAAGTVMHDIVLTPIDVVKQRLQLGAYAGTKDCITSTLRREGVRAFYISLPATLAMNVPYTGLLVASNEMLKNLCNVGGAGSGDDASLANAPWYFFTAGVSGAFAGALTLPFDVVKTRLQTQKGGPAVTSDVRRYDGFVSTVRRIHLEEGYLGFFRGFVPRIALAMPSAAMCWGTYETVRISLRRWYPHDS